MLSPSRWAGAWLALAVAASSAAAGAAAAGHHSIAGIYDGTREVTIEAVVVRFEFIDPHPFVIVDVREGAATQQWRLEMDNRFELVQIGMAADTLKAGDRVVVAGRPSRQQPHALYVNRLDRPADRFRYEQIGSSPRIRRR